MSVLTMSVLTAVLAHASVDGDEPLTSAPISLEPLWVADGFDAPESVLVLEDGTLLVANVGGEGADRDGNGRIAHVGADGAMIDPHWAAGLDAPKGMAVHDGVLHVTDIDRVVRFDLESAQPLGAIAIEGAGFLNDAAALPGQGVIVADSATRRIHLIEGGAASVWFESEAVSGLNGLFVEDDRVLVAAMDDHLYAIDVATRAAAVLTEGISNGDGVAPAPGGGYLVSSWPGRVFHWSEETGLTTLVDERDDGVFQNDFAVSGDILYVPNWMPGTVTAWRIGPAD